MPIKWIVAPRRAGTLVTSHSLHTRTKPTPDHAGNLENASGSAVARSGWPAAFDPLQRDSRLWLGFFLSLWLFLWLMIWLFRDQSNEALRTADLVKCAVAGARFDCVVATYWILPGTSVAAESLNTSPCGTSTWASADWAGGVS